MGASLANVGTERIAAAVAFEGRRRLTALVDGIESYRCHPYCRTLSEPPTIWQDGTTRLLDYGAGAPADTKRQPAVLVVPSLINRAYILDLEPDHSLLRYLAIRRLRPFLVDWGGPGDRERRFSLDDYIAGRLVGAHDAMRRVTRGRPLLIGYCMGGLLALALAQLRPAGFAGFALLATPWNFHVEQVERAQLMGPLAAALEPVLQSLGELPVDLIQLLFAGLDPFLVARKFVGFAALKQTSTAARHFVAIEDWLNDGVPLAAPVARECLAGWYGDNTPATGMWRIAGQAVRPEAVNLPSLVVVPDRDRIVPPASAEALAVMLPRATTLRPESGHIGMIVGRDAERRLWRPLADWLHRVAAA